MNATCKTLFVAALAFGSTAAFSAELEKKTLLYVGTQANVNAGVVTTSENHLNGTTKKIGYTVDDTSAKPEGDFVEVFVGTTPNVNAGVVTTSTNHAGGSTQSIGYLSTKPVKGGKKLYVGEVDNCNAGVVTPDTKHLNCATHFVGYALPQ